MDIPGSKTLTSPMAVSQRAGWQTEAWEMLDLVGELRYYVSWRASACSRVRLIASELDDQGRPTGECDNDEVNAIVTSIAGNQLGQSQLIKRIVECLTIPGETWIAIIFPPDAPPWGVWLALTRDEFQRRTTSGRAIVELPDGSHYELTPDDTMFRVWLPHPRRAKEANSPVRSALDALREIVRTTRKIRNADNSRLIGNGVVFVPQEMSLPAVQSPVSADKPDGSVGMSGTPAVKELQEMLFDVAKASYEDEDSFAAMIPIFASVPGEMVDKVQHLTFDATLTDMALKTRADAVHRLAMSLEVSPERLLGMGRSTNHWSAWQIGDNDIQIHIAPMMETICQGLTAQVFRKMLIAKGIDETKYLVWYDTGQLTDDPNKTDNATAAFDRGAITAEAYRDFLNLGDSGYDFSTIEGWRIWATDKVSKNPELLVQLMPLLDGSVQALEFPVMIEVEEGPKSNSESGGGAADSSPTNEGNSPDTEDKGPGYDQGTRGTKDGVDSNHAGQVVIELMVSRALELAGKRRRTRVNYERLREVPLHETHRFMGPVRGEDVDKLIRGWDSALEQDTLALVGLDCEQVRAEVIRQVRAQLTAEVINA